MKVVAEGVIQQAEVVLVCYFHVFFILKLDYQATLGKKRNTYLHPDPLNSRIFNRLLFFFSSGTKEKKS